jgi:hypothetical protein
MVLAWPRSSAVTAADDDTGPWAGGVTANDLAEAAGLIGPVRRLLLLLGYEVGALYLQAAGGSQWARLDLVTWVASGETVATGEKPDGSFSTGPLLAVGAVPLPNAASEGQALAAPLPPGLGWHSDDSFLYLHAHDPGSSSVASAQFLETMDAFVETAVAAAAAGLEEVPPTPDSGSGLLWLIDPAYWWADPVGMSTSPHVRAMEASALEARETVFGELAPQVFLTDQVSGVATPRRPSPIPLFRGQQGPPTLKQVLRWRDDKSFLAPSLANQFFTNLHGLVHELALDARLPTAAIDELRDVSWLGVLVTLVANGVLTPPALEVEIAGETTGPMEAERVDEHTVDVTVLGQLTVTIRRVRDADGNHVFPTEPAGEDHTILTPVPEFTWDYLVPPDPTRAPVFVVVAAPGVDVLVPSAPEPVGWELLIIRVQDVSLVPEWGTAVDPSLLLAPYEISPTPAQGFELQLPEQPPAAPSVQVLPRPDGVGLSYPMYPTGDGMQLVGVSITLGPDAIGSPDVRFAWDVTYYHDDRAGFILPDPTAHLSIWATAGVTVEVVTTIPTEFRDYQLQTEVWQVRDFADIPGFGSELPFDTGALAHFAGFAEGWEPMWTSSDGGMPARIFTPGGTFTDQIGFTALFTFLADLIVGMIPLVGDVVDIAEFAHALATGKDRWGQPVTGIGWIFLGVGAMMPFASGSLAKGMGQTIEGLTGPIGAVPAPLRRTAGPAVTATTGVDTLVQLARRPQGMSVKEAESLVRQTGAWRSLTPFERTEVAGALRGFVSRYAQEFARTVVGQFLVLDDLVDGTGQAFRIPSLRRDHGYWASRMLANDPNADTSVEAFIEAATLQRFAGPVGPPSMRSRAVLQALLGPGVVGGAVRRARRAASAAVNWKSLASLVFRRQPPSQNWLLDRILRGDLVGEVRNLINARTGDEATFGPLLWFQQIFLTRFSMPRPSVGNYVERVEALLALVARTANQPTVTIDSLRALLGPTKSFYTKELAELVVRALDLLETDLFDAARRGLGDVLPIGDGLPRIEGVLGFIRAVITGKGFEHGARHEIRMAAREIAAAGNVFIRMGARLPGILDTTLREGPDLLRYLGRSSIVADILQGKAYSSLRSLISTVEPPRWMLRGGPWRGPEIFRQTISDILRMANADPPFMVESLDGTGLVRFSGNFEIVIDRVYYLTSRARPSGLSERYINRISNLSVNEIGAHLTPDEIIEVIDDLKNVKSAEEIDELLEVYVLPHVQEQIEAFLRQPRADLNKALGVTIPDDMNFTFTVRFE